MLKIFRKITAGVKTEHWTIGDSDYNKYVREDDAYFITEHQKSEADLVSLGASEITQTEWESYTDETVSFIPGSRPPHKPRP